MISATAAVASVGVQRGVQRDALAGRAAASTAPVTELRRNSRPSCPDRLAGLDDLAVAAA